eukprot:TRINITY_DN4399_c0_g1_i1.p1 TRINITY_DN4399_c0_g1~~TRINITY_DN4399_c0_g1_i1.p1  ORF type:complete len:199 (+),score=27.71 TRINITY_DN4399_c0_g1_i1:44-598(+)
MGVMKKLRSMLRRKQKEIPGEVRCFDADGWEVVEYTEAASMESCKAHLQLCTTTGSSASPSCEKGTPCDLPKSIHTTPSPHLRLLPPSPTWSSSEGHGKQQVIPHYEAREVLMDKAALKEDHWQDLPHKSKLPSSSPHPSLNQDFPQANPRFHSNTKHPKHTTVFVLHVHQSFTFTTTSTRQRS